MSRPLTLRNQAFATVTPRLSVLIPFYRESPLPLLRALKTRDPHALEVILIDDGSGQPELTDAVTAFIQQSPIACELITLTANEGRARGRNCLTSAARGDFFLFLDSDMLPDDDGFLDRWLSMAHDPQNAVVFGGFSLIQAPTDARYKLHRLMAGHSDCLTAAQRALVPEKYVYTSNLLVRRDVFEAEGFDSSFTGWGWEDVEWAMRVAARYPIGHIDNAATHMGLDTPDSLARKYQQSEANFARVVAKHPAVIATYPSYRVARRLKGLPGLGLIRSLARAVALTPLAPMKLRALSLRLYRASLYARVV